MTEFRATLIQHDLILAPPADTLFPHLGTFPGLHCIFQEDMLQSGFAQQLYKVPCC